MYCVKLNGDNGICTGKVLLHFPGAVLETSRLTAFYFKPCAFQLFQEKNGFYSERCVLFFIWIKMQSVDPSIFLCLTPIHLLIREIGQMGPLWQGLFPPNVMEAHQICDFVKYDLILNMIVLLSLFYNNFRTSGNMGANLLECLCRTIMNFWIGDS